MTTTTQAHERAARLVDAERRAAEITRGRKESADAKPKTRRLRPAAVLSAIGGIVFLLAAVMADPYDDAGKIDALVVFAKIGAGFVGTALMVSAAIFHAAIALGDEINRLRLR